MIFAQVFLVLFFLLASSIKMIGWIKFVFDQQLAFFRRYGLNREVMFAVGVIEAVGALTLLVGFMTGDPLLNVIGAGLLALTSLGAIFFHFWFDTWKEALPALLTLCLSVWIAVVHASTLFPVLFTPA